MKAAGQSIISFTVGEPDFDTPGHIVEAAKAAMDAGHSKYTDTPGVLPLREAICRKLKGENGLDYTPAQIVVSNGAKHAISNACAAIINPGDEVIIPAPYWLTYPEIVGMYDGVPIYVDTTESSYKITAAQVEAAITPKSKAIFLNTPNNPSGAVYTESELRAIADVCCKHDLIVLSDEIYEHLIYEEGLRHISIASFNEDIRNRTIVINGLSKSFAMTGWRMGYTASNADIAKLIGNIQSHQTSNINAITQLAAIAAIDGDKQPLHDMVSEFAKRRDYMMKKLTDIGFELNTPPGAFYCFIDISKFCGDNIKDAADFAAMLVDKAGVVVVPCADFGCPMHIRLSYACSMNEITEGCDRIRQVIKP